MTEKTCNEELCDDGVKPSEMYCDYHCGVIYGRGDDKNSFLREAVENLRRAGYGYNHEISRKIQKLYDKEGDS